MFKEKKTACLPSLESALLDGALLHMYTPPERKVMMATATNGGSIIGEGRWSDAFGTLLALDADLFKGHVPGRIPDGRQCQYHSLYTCLHCFVRCEGFSLDAWVNGQDIVVLLTGSKFGIADKEWDLAHERLRIADDKSKGVLYSTKRGYLLREYHDDKGFLRTEVVRIPPGGSKEKAFHYDYIRLGRASNFWTAVDHAFLAPEIELA